jgi:membrane fusion protein (multidrug efflux system)
MKETTEKKPIDNKADHKRPVLIGGIFLGVIAVAGVIALVVWIASLGTLSTDDAAIDGLHVSVASKIMGRIEETLVDEGITVRLGEILARLDTKDIEAQRAQFEASLENTTLNLELAKINLERTKNDFERVKKVYKSGNSTPEQYDHAEKTLDAANVQYEIARAQIETAKAQLGIVETQLSNTNITAPIAGTIAKRNYSAGEVVQPGQAIFVINDLERAWVIANFEETKIRGVSPGAPVDITIDAYPGRTFKGHVEMVSAAIVPPPFSIGESTKTTQKIPVKILFTPVPHNVTLRPGMSVEVVVKKR